MLLFMDEHVPSAITRGLRLRGVDVLTTQEDGSAGLKDPELLDCATAMGRIIYTEDQDFLVEALMRQEKGISLPESFIIISWHYRSDNECENWS